ncbi:MAG: nuclear transport factor 2 family protein [Chitinophagaceae bacterium]|nr:nuclear transport factor 2 family protein [Chitinophagaceae bacterium]MBK9381046.1 nuclear transport factor 2 family protein [Chitinophagaceae bacterium]MBL0307571.1 nuclear transport factor 2 family protein [Chitinophagaceae bacterium]HQV61472.1 nuclear transport factor 2 family protein [Chitinophagaceae bacterium]HQV85890.1 nuclear transport factor 2 family protein [Chitinophagaceae bacterium]
MKKIIILLIATVLTRQLYAQGQLTRNQQAVQQAVLKLFNALSNRDSVNLKLFCADDITLYEYGQIWNLDTLINKAIRLNTASDFKRINTIDFINTTISKKAAWTTYLNQADINRDGKQTTVKWIETVVLVKQQKRWKIKVLHSTLIK